MQGLVRAAAVGVLFVSAGVLAFEAVRPEADLPLPSSSSSRGKTLSSSELQRSLEAREREVAELKAKLAEVDDSALYAKAVSLGVADAVKQSGLTERGMRRLAVAIVREAEKHGVDPLLVVAVIRCESSFNNFAVSGVGAMGLMQVMPDTGKYLMSERGETLKRPSNLFDYELNVELGTSYLADLIQRFGSVEGALVAYNAGPAAAKKILANREVRKKFIKGYPKKVVGEWTRLKDAHQNLARNDSAPSGRL